MTPEAPGDLCRATADSAGQVAESDETDDAREFEPSSADPAWPGQPTLSLAAARRAESGVDRRDNAPARRPPSGDLRRPADRAHHAKDADETNRRLLELNWEIAAGRVAYAPFAYLARKDRATAS
jgi:hypothetical protein